MTRLLALVYLLVALPVLSAPVVCTQDGLTRSIEVVYSDPGQPLPCEVLYDKRDEGSQSSLWRAEHTAGYCEERADQLAGKLIDLGWSCSASEDAQATAAEAEITVAPED